MNLMDDKTRVAVLVLIAAIVISSIGSIAIAFACGYVMATVVNSPSFVKLAVQQRFTRFLQAFREDK